MSLPTWPELKEWLTSNGRLTPRNEVMAHEILHFCAKFHLASYEHKHGRDTLPPYETNRTGDSPAVHELCDPRANERLLAVGGVNGETRIRDVLTNDKNHGDRF